ncbi:M56 family metallopeptidase [Aureliella helgolandensis]|uniref:Regulatory protein BlaR1 n=1 Tax=Aureliella helgolandensis TaxID=2527968 RepID=A0A518G7T8_9BACT|nr:M56 family metallopeptidase [Aureliella helgolandensis]QDV24651.1 Regulatory protein BlaR1 [Aureliella helgolandensis]
MMPSIDWQSLSLQLVTTFAHFLWQGSLIGILLAVLLRVVAARSASTRYIFASAAFASLPLCVVVTLAIVHAENGSLFLPSSSAGRALPAFAQSTMDAPLTAPEMGAVASTRSPAVHLPTEEAEAVALPSVGAANRAPSWLASTPPYVLVVYVLGVAVSLLRLAASIWASGRLRRAVQTIKDSPITRIIPEQAKRMGLRTIPLFGLCDQIAVPIVVGILKPTILLPPAILCGLDPQQLAAILSHEMAHIRRYDLLVNLVQRIVEAFLFFHPVTWWISRRLSIEREDCCDDLAVAGCGRLEFAEALLSMAEISARQQGMAIGMQLEALAADGGNQSQLTRRIRRLLSEVDAPRVVLSRLSLVIGLVAALLLSVSVLAYAQNKVSNRDASSERKERMPVEDQTEFASPPARYTHLVYDQSVADPLQGLKTARVMQPLPLRGRGVEPAVPFAEQSLVAESSIMLRSRGIDSRIDLSQSEAAADRQLSPQYELRGQRYYPSLWYGDEQLAEVIHFRNVGVSPDGLSIAWYTRSDSRDRSNLGNTSQHPTTLWFHSPDAGTVKLAEGNFGRDDPSDTFDSPILRPRFHWLANAGLAANAKPAERGAEQQTADPEYSNLPIAWGESKNGMRVGAMFTDEAHGTLKRFRHGDLAQLQLFVQNVGPVAIKCQVLLPHPLDGWGLELENIEGDSIPLNRIFNSAYSPLRLFEAELAAKEIQPITGRLPKFREGNEDDGYVPELEHVEFQIEAKPPEQGQHVQPFVYGLENGTYTASSFLTLRRADSPTADISVSTGRIAFQVGEQVGDAEDVGPVEEPKIGQADETPGPVAAVPPPPKLPVDSTNMGVSPAAAKVKRAKVEDGNEVQNPSHYEGRVLGPDGQPMQGAEVFVISDWNETTRLGPVRDVTNAEGQFSFDAPDMTWQSMGKTMRRGGLIVAKKQGFVPEWMETWGHARGVFSTGLWGQTQSQTLELQLTQDDVPIRGQLLDVDGNPVAGARVRLTRMMIPRNRDLTAFLEHWSKANLTAIFMTGISYKREINKHFELMDLRSEWISDANGRIEISGIGRDRIARFEVTAPSIVTTRIDVMARDTENVGILLDGLDGKGQPTQTIYGANFSIKLKSGLTVTGVVRDRATQRPVAGMWVTTGGYSPLTAPQQTKGAVVTGSDGRFTLSGLNPKLLEYEQESTRRISAIPQPGVQFLRAGTVFEKDKDTVIETVQGIGYRLKVVDEDGLPIQATVEYRRVQPNSVGLELIRSVGGGAEGHLNHAVLREDGTYEGFVLPGPGAVLVSVPGSAYRPASIDPKNFFAPGKSWDDDSTYTYGTPSLLSVGGSWLDPRKYEAIVLVNPARDSKSLTLTATLLRDRPRMISLVDTEGTPVAGAVALLHERRGTSIVKQTIRGPAFPLSGLNVDRDQWITFMHQARKLATVVAIRGDEDAGVSVKLQPWGTVKGRFVDARGAPVGINGEAKFSTIVKDASHAGKQYFPHTVGEDGTFQIEGFAAGQSYSSSGTYRKRKNYIREGMFQNLVLSPGEIRDLGDIEVQTP